MDRLEAMRAFTAVVNEGGFAAAARSMGLSRSAVNKSVLALEDDLGVQLLTRSTRRVTPTDTGLAFYERCLRILADVDDTLRSVAEFDGEPAGRIRINAPMTFGTRALAGIAAEYLRRYPEVHVELVLNDRVIDPIEEGFDLTVRIGEVQTSTSLVVHELMPIPRVLCASGPYLEQYGAPSHPSELNNHRCLHYGYLSTGNVWRLAGPDGARSYRISCVMWSNNGEVLKEAAIAGQGIALLPTFIVGPALTTGALVTVLDAYRPPEVSLSALYPRHRHLSATVRRFVELLEEHVAESRWA